MSLEETMKQFCETGALAVQRYAEVSGLDPCEMPKYFMQSFMLDHIGDDVRMTLGINFRKLIDYNGGRSGYEEDLTSIGNPIVDAVMYKNPHLPKEKQDFLALIELKGGYIDVAQLPGRVSDQDKLLRILRHIDKCPYGIACGWTTEQHAEYWRPIVEKAGDGWFQSELFQTHGVPHRFCASLFDCSAKPTQLFGPTAA